MFNNMEDSIVELWVNVECYGSTKFRYFWKIRM